jgi:hypothetical protein
LLAASVLCAAIGLALAFSASTRALSLGLAAAAAGVIGGAFTEPGPELRTWIGSAGWVLVLVSALCVHLPRRLGVAAALPLGLVGGGLAGSITGGGGEWKALAQALPWTLLAIPGAWLVARRRGLIVKIVLSWLGAAAALSLGLNMTPTLGFEPDHMG